MRWSLSSGTVLVAADDFGHLEERTIRIGSVLQDPIQGQSGLDKVLAKDVAQGNGMGHGLDSLDVGLSDLGDVVQDRIKLSAETGNLEFVQGQPGELGNVAYLVGCNAALRH